MGKLLADIVRFSRGLDQHFHLPLKKVLLKAEFLTSENKKEIEERFTEHQAELSATYAKIDDLNTQFDADRSSKLSIAILGLLNNTAFMENYWAVDIDMTRKSGYGITKTLLWQTWVEKLHSITRRFPELIMGPRRSWGSGKTVNT